MNSLVLVLQWAFHLSGVDDVAMGQGAVFFRDLEATQEPVDLMQVQGWQLLIAGWTEAHRQHDICEFLQHVLASLSSPLFQGTWQARQLAANDGAACCIDHGHGTQALALHLPVLPPGLKTELEVQTLVDHWHKDHDRTTCFQTCPQLLFLQIMRFSRKRGQISKDRTEVKLTWSLDIPVFINDRLDRSQVRYTLLAYVVHHGLSPKAGHYTAHLIQDGGKCWSCDDNRPALLEGAPQPKHFRDMYLLLYAKTDSRHDA